MSGWAARCTWGAAWCEALHKHTHECFPEAESGCILRSARVGIASSKSSGPRTFDGVSSTTIAASVEYSENLRAAVC